MMHCQMQSAMDILNEIWREFRPEKVKFEGPPQIVPLKRNVDVEVYSQEYTDVRDQRVKTVKLIVFKPVHTFGVPLCRKLLSLLSNDDSEDAIQRPDHVVILCSKSSKKVLECLNEEVGLIWEVLYYDELRVNKLKNRLVPSMHIVTDLDAAYKELGTSDMMHVPRIRAREDAAARLLGVRHQDLILITRYDSVVGVSREYRYANDILQVDEDADDGE